MTITAIIHPNIYPGIDHICIHGANIADPHNNENVIWDDGDRPVFVIAVDSSEDEAPYRDALDQIGFDVTGADRNGDWTLRQRRTV